MTQGALTTQSAIGVIGAGTMGAGIAQVAATAGHKVYLFDMAADAATKAIANIGRGLERLVTSGKMSAQKRADILARLQPSTGLTDLAPCALVIEAIVENLQVKQKLFAELETILPKDAILATNTSSISVTSIGCGLQDPARLVGMHFFNPAPIMKLVEVIKGVATTDATAATVLATAQAWGKVAVYAKSTPGFIVNRVARAYYAEPMRLCEEQLADPATLDALLTEGAGFRMGPFELMDLIGHDVNFAVTQSVYNAFYQEPRFRPSILQQELVNAGKLGRKTNGGFYDYIEGKTQKPQPRQSAPTSEAQELPGLELGQAFEFEGALFVPSDGRRAFDVAAIAGKPALVYDLYLPGSKRLAFAASADMPAALKARFVANLAAKGITATELADWPGLVVLRTIALIANEGHEAVLQGVCDKASVDQAMVYGVNYPKGPMAWADEIGLKRILATLDTLLAQTGDPRYRASFGLRQAAAA